MFVSSNQHLLSVKICGQPQPIPSSLQDVWVPIPCGMVHKTLPLLPGAAATFPSLSVTFHFLVGMKLTGNHKWMDRGRRGKAKAAETARVHNYGGWSVHT